MADGCSLLILAGGSSRRMGRDKASLPAGGMTLVEHLAARLGPAVDETLVAGGQRSMIGQLFTVQDRFPEAGPLAGMDAGFRVASQPLVWVVACDLPEVEARLANLLRGASTGVDAVVPQVGGELQGVCALYRPGTVLPVIERLLAEGGRSVRSLLERLDVRPIGEAELRNVDPDLRSFRNLNTPADYKAWLRTR